VARLAGLPAAVLARAEEVLHHLEQGEAKGTPARLAEDLPLLAQLFLEEQNAAGNRPCAMAEPRRSVETQIRDHPSWIGLVES
jgi:DNA mismatch repair protein MutS